MFDDLQELLLNRGRKGKQPTHSGNSGRVGDGGVELEILPWL